MLINEPIETLNRKQENYPKDEHSWVFVSKSNKNIYPQRQDSSSFSKCRMLLFFYDSYNAWNCSGERSFSQLKKKRIKKINFEQTCRHDEHKGKAHIVLLSIYIENETLLSQPFRLNYWLFLLKKNHGKEYFIFK